MRAYFRNFTVSLMTHANCIGLWAKTFESLGVRLDATDRELNFHAGKTVVNNLKEKLRYDQLQRFHISMVLSLKWIQVH